MDYDMLLDLAAELGYRLMDSGAEIYRVEESVGRLLRAYGLEQPEVFAIPSCLIVSVTAPTGHPVTRMRRVGAHGTDIGLLEECNALCRTLCAVTPPLPEAQEMVRALPAVHRVYRPALRLLGYGLAPAFFTPLFGGGLRDGVCALLCGLAVGAILLYGKKILGVGGFLQTIVCSALAAFLAMALVCAGLGLDRDTIIIGTLMILVPGVALTNAMRELMAGDTYSGLSHMAEALLIAAAIALGSAVGLGAAGLIWTDVPVVSAAAPGGALMGYVLPCLCAAAACLGFTLVFNIQGWGKLICGAGGALGWLVYLLAGQSVLAAFFAAVAIGVFSEVMARLRRCPATGYLLTALLPLVPGSGIYYAMTYCLDGDISRFLSELLRTLGIAAALAVGAMLALSVFRAAAARKGHISR